MDLQNSATVAGTLPGPAPGAPPPRQLAAGEGAAWWGESWRIFCAAPAVWIGIFVLFVIVSIALVMIPVVGSLIHTVLIPVLAGGVMLGCHALARGEPLRIGHLFEGFQGGRFAPLCLLGLLAQWLVGTCLLGELATRRTRGPRSRQACRSTKCPHRRRTRPVRRSRTWPPLGGP